MQLRRSIISTFRSCGHGVYSLENQGINRKDKAPRWKRELCVIPQQEDSDVRIVRPTLSGGGAERESAGKKQDCLDVPTRKDKGLMAGLAESLKQSDAHVVIIV